MTINAVEYSEEYLDAFKERMRIFHKEEDENLLRMLAASITAISALTGCVDGENPLFMELVLERSRYVYHDALDEFQKNYEDEIEMQYLMNKFGGESSQNEQDNQG